MIVKISPKKEYICICWLCQMSLQVDILSTYKDDITGAVVQECIAISNRTCSICLAHGECCTTSRKIKL